jgi:hypothetical protein
LLPPASVAPTELQQPERREEAVVKQEAVKREPEQQSEQTVVVKRLPHGRSFSREPLYEILRANEHLRNAPVHGKCELIRLYADKTGYCPSEEWFREGLRAFRRNPDAPILDPY